MSAGLLVDAQTRHVVSPWYWADQGRPKVARASAGRGGLDAQRLAGCRARGATSGALDRASSPLAMIDGILHADAHMAAEQPGLRHHRQCRAADAEAGPDRARRQQVARIHHRLRRGVEAVAHAEHDREASGGPSSSPSAIRSRARWISPESNSSISGFTPGRADHPRHAAHVGGRVDHHLLAGIHRVEVERADIRLQHRDMLDPLLRRHQRGAGAGDRGIVLARHKRPPGPVVRLMITSRLRGACGPSHRGTDRAPSTGGRSAGRAHGYARSPPLPRPLPARHRRSVPA